MYRYEWVVGSQTEKPKELDVDSSQFVVYLRKNIQEYEQKDDDGQVIFKGWKYQELVVPNEQFITTALSDQTEINDALLLSISDIYELVDSLSTEIQALKEKVNG